MNNKLKNENAKAVAERALKWINHSHENWSNDMDMLAGGTKDYLDLMNIAIMIEKNESKKKIARRMYILDTIIREEIPVQVYRIYTK